MDIFAQNYKELRKYALNLCKDSNLADDVLHEAYIMFRRGTREYVDLKNCYWDIKASFWRHTGNHRSNSLAKIRGSRDQYIPDYKEFLNIPEKDSYSFEDEVLDVINTNLGTKFREVMYMYYKGYSREQVAEKSGYSKNYVQNIINNNNKLIEQALWRRYKN